MALRSLLLWAGTERFETHVRAFENELHSTGSDPQITGWSGADGVLWIALAEALGYGQYSETLRQAGIRLLAGNSLELDDARRIERVRLGGLLALWDRWRVTGPWEPLRAALISGPTAVIVALRVSGGAISASAGPAGSYDSAASEYCPA